MGGPAPKWPRRHGTPGKDATKWAPSASRGGAGGAAAAPPGTPAPAKWDARPRARWGARRRRCLALLVPVALALVFMDFTAPLRARGGAGRSSRRAQGWGLGREPPLDSGGDSDEYEPDVDNIDEAGSRGLDAAATGRTLEEPLSAIGRTDIMQHRPPPGLAIVGGRGPLQEGLLHASDKQHPLGQSMTRHPQTPSPGLNPAASSGTGMPSRLVPSPQEGDRGTLVRAAESSSASNAKIPALPRPGLHTAASSGTGVPSSLVPSSQKGDRVTLAPAAEGSSAKNAKSPPLSGPGLGAVASSGTGMPRSVVPPPQKGTAGNGDPLVLAAKSAGTSPPLEQEPLAKQGATPSTLDATVVKTAKGGPSVSPTPVAASMPRATGITALAGSTAPTTSNTSGERACGALYDPARYQEVPGVLQKVPFRPMPDKYLLMYCVRGQISNRMLCMRNHLLLAGLLNRTLIVPVRVNEQYEYQYDIRLVFDLEQARRCLGDAAVISTEEYEQLFGRRVAIDKLHCWQGPARSCPEDPRMRDLDCPAQPHPGRAINTINKAPNHTQSVPLFLDPLSHMQAFFVEDSDQGMLVYGSCLGPNRTFEEVEMEWGVFKDRILAVGDLVDRKLYHPSIPHAFLERVFQRRDGCEHRPLIGPPEGLVERAREITNSLFGGDRRQGPFDGRFLAVHWRRGDFVRFCFQAIRTKRCFYPPDHAANCTLRHALANGLNHVFLATNAGQEEVAVFEKYITDNSGGRVIVRMFPPNVVLEPKWLGKENTTQQRILVEALLDKLIAAQATVFLGSVESTFTKDIVALRYGMATISCHDSLVCFGEEEWDTDTLLPESIREEKRRWFVEMERKRLAEEERERQRKLRHWQLLLEKNASLMGTPSTVPP